MTKPTRYARPVVHPAKRDITVSINDDGLMVMEWTGEGSDVVRLWWVSKEDTAFRALGNVELCVMGSVYWLMPEMRRQTATKVLNAAADLIAEGRLREVPVALARIYMDSGDLDRFHGTSSP